MTAQPDKKEMVRQMFDDISPRYDFLNHFLSMGIDKRWRSRLVRMVGEHHPSRLLDVATGTGDLALALSSIDRSMITGIDISGQMLEIGKKKILNRGLSQQIMFQLGDAENLPFGDNSFDAVTVAFGVRNFADLSRGIREMRRVLRAEGRVFILEFSHPGTFPMKQLYGFYSRFIIPLAGRMISGNNHAYRYLPESVAAFPSGNDFLGVLHDADLRELSCTPLSAGIASIYSGKK
jgi:demethylmenaquinone methyltransferase/2-methoxy-6-polyprenyl-1,4-benzoquinol methylase